MDWRRRAMCHSLVQEGKASPELWFPQNKGEAAAAVRWCSVCPVKNQCLLYAVSHRVYGVWGGRYLGPDAIRKRRFDPA